MLEKPNNLNCDFDKLVTIIMPVKNGELLIKDAIKSINRQTIKPAKVILADNNSTDRTTEIFKNNLKESINIEVYKSKTDIKSMQNFFRCIDKVETKYFCWLAHDDYFEDNWIEENLKVHFKNDECITSFGECIFIDEKHNRFYRTGINKNMHVPKSYAKGDLMKFINERQLWGVMYEFGLHNTYLFKKAFSSKKIINKLSSINIGGDTCLTLSLLSKGSLISTQKTKFYKRDLKTSNGYRQTKTTLLFRVFILELPWSYFKNVTDWIAITFKKKRIIILFILLLTSRIQSFKKIFLRLINEIKILLINVFK